ncbi:hypothetical protein ZIOFF_069141 [Zingiber officinale]|uniref:tRNA-binding domain-containing protein n=1 Tax=Zingiber officinale TaxID=94328 RepID=A0A8J5EPP2_ZINOF|nr:hypothetical protein ZIOFF_069141 [Zingiber officinale]
MGSGAQGDLDRVPIAGQLPELLCRLFTCDVVSGPTCLEQMPLAGQHPDCRGNSKKQHNKPSGSTKTKSAETEISVSRLDIPVGLIKKVQKHPDADSLYVEEIDVGEESPRTVVSGLVKYIPLEEMQNRKVELVDPPSSAKVGERVTFLGYSGEPNSVLNAKSKVWEKLQVDLQSNKEWLPVIRMCLSQHLLVFVKFRLSQMEP